MSSSSARFSIDTSATSPSSPQASRTSFPFPERTTSRQPSYLSRRGSNTSTFSTGQQSIGGSLDLRSATRRGSSSLVRETSQNAISALLQPPIVRTGVLPHTQAAAGATAWRAPTTRDIPPVTLTNVDKVPNERFQDYLKRVGPLFDQYQRGRAEPEGQQASWLKKDKDLEKTDRFAEALDERLRRGSVGSIGSTSSPRVERRESVLSPAEATSIAGGPRRKFSGHQRRNRNEPTPLSTIPNVYFEEDFHLENPRTFDVVSERAALLTTHAEEKKEANGVPLPPRKALATNAILQEKLSWYMDTVEVHLINNISTASTGFFAALGSLKELQTEAEESIVTIQQLRDDLKRLDGEVAVGGLEVAGKRRRRANVEKLQQATKQVQAVVDNVKKADELVEDGSYDEAVDQLERVGRIVSGEAEGEDNSEGLIDLRSLQALQGLEGGILALQYRIGAGFASRFSASLLSDLRAHVDKVPPQDTLKRWSRQRGIAPLYLETSDQLRKDLEGSLKGLGRAGHTAAATAAFRETVMKEMKTLIRKHLPSSSDDDAESMVSISTRGGHKLSQQEKSSILARNLRAMDEEDAEKMLLNIYTSIGEALRRLSTQTKVLLDVSSRMKLSEPPKPPTKAPTTVGDTSTIEPYSPLTPRINVQEELSHALDMSSLLGQAVDTAQSQITRVLKVRNEQTIRLSKERFMRYFTLNRLFADECEAISGRGGQALKGLINAQIGGFVQALSQQETERIAQLLDSDEWNAQDFSAKDDIILQRVLGAMSSDPVEWTRSTPIWEKLDTDMVAPNEGTNGQPATNGTSTPAANGEKTATKAAAKPAYIDETRFILVKAANELLPTMDKFLSLTASLPSMTPQIATSLLDVLKTFNSRSCQLILGAGATRSAGLKNITTKHLALASQALSFVIALIPYTRECARRHLSAGQTSVLAEFDKTKRLYQDHQSGIHDKLIEIMTGRSQAHVKAMTAIDFDATSSGDADKPSPYMETLTKETLTLHRVLARHLSEVDLSMITRQIFSAYKDQWTKAYGEKDPSTEAGGKRMLRDAECMRERLGKIDGFEQAGEAILAVVRVKVDTADDNKTDKKGKATAGKTSLEILGVGKK